MDDDFALMKTMANREKVPIYCRSANLLVWPDHEHRTLEEEAVMSSKALGLVALMKHLKGALK